MELEDLVAEPMANLADMKVRTALGVEDRRTGEDARMRLRELQRLVGSGAELQRLDEATLRRHLAALDDADRALPGAASEKAFSEQSRGDTPAPAPRPMR
jgi:hypothetical protein